MQISMMLKLNLPHSVPLFLSGLNTATPTKQNFLADIGYDATFEGLRLGGGVLFGWTKFRLKLGVAYFNPAGSGDFTLPQIGLWWRFRG